MWKFVLVFGLLTGFFQNSFSKENSTLSDWIKTPKEAILTEDEWSALENGKSMDFSEELNKTVKSIPDTVKIGIFINSIHDLKFEESSFKADFWLWCVYKNKELPIKDWIEFPNTKSFEFSNYVQKEYENVQWLTLRGNGVILKEWDARRFPFDTYKLEITLGLSAPTEEVVFLADTKGSKINPDFELLDWTILNDDFSDEKKRYSTSFGDPIGAQISEYPEFKTSISLARKNPWRNLIKYCLGLIIALLISVSALLMPPDKDPRFDLCVGGLFTSVGNKYITDNITPVSSGLTILDLLHNLTFVCIFIIIVVSVINLFLIKNGGKDNYKKAKRLDLYSFLFVSGLILIGSYIIIR
jgi:hypothetical protein